MKCSNIQNIRVPEGEEEEQEVENLSEKIMKKNFPNVVKELDMQVQDTQNPKQVGSKKKYTKTHHN